MSARLRFATRAARGAPPPQSASKPLVPGIQLANVYVFEDLQQVDSVWEGREAGYVYGRFGTPNHTILEDTLAALEGGEAGLVVASGMAALSAFLLGGLRTGDHLVVGQDLYGTTTALLREQAGRWGIRVSFADATEPASVEAALTDATRAIFVEAVSNPLLRLADLPGLAAIARRRAIALLVDSTFASPALLRPLEHGATSVHHSATKYLSGHGDVTAGVLVGSRALVDAARTQAVRIGLNLGPVRRVAHPPRGAHARRADGAALGQRARARALPREATRGGARPLPGLAQPPAARARAHAASGRLWWHAVLRSRRGGARRSTGSSAGWPEDRRRAGARR